ncbi:hypothetical protein [Neobacillus sp. Marseille-QA0830]
MQSIIWAIGSMAVLMLIVSFLPLGYSQKGKVLVVFVSFLLSLIGVAAVSSFSIWLTALMMLALSFFSAYFINNRFETMLIKEPSFYENELDDEFTEQEENYSKVNRSSQPLLAESDQDISSPESSSIPNLEEELVLAQNVSTAVNEPEELELNDVPMLDDDISFLLNRSTEAPVQKKEEETNLETGYLSDIESLLEIESELEKDVLPQESAAVRKDSMEVKELDTESDELEELDDLLLDFSLAQKQVAVGKDEKFVLDDDAFLEEKKEKVNLQK